MCPPLATTQRPPPCEELVVLARSWLSSRRNYEITASSKNSEKSAIVSGVLRFCSLAPEAMLHHKSLNTPAHTIAHAYYSKIRHHPRQRRAARVRGRWWCGEGVGRGGPPAEAAAAPGRRVVGGALLPRQRADGGRLPRRGLGSAALLSLLALGVRGRDALLDRGEALAQARLGARHHLS